MKGTPRGLRLRPRDTVRRMSQGGYRWRRADVTPPSRDTLVWHRVCVLPRRYKRAGTRRTHRTPGLAGSWSRHRGRRPDSIRPGDLTNTAPHWLDRRYFGVHCLTSRRTASFGAGSRTVTTTFVNLYGSVETHGDAKSVLRVTREFAKLDASFHSGELSPPLGTTCDDYLFRLPRGRQFGKFEVRGEMGVPRRPPSSRPSPCCSDAIDCGRSWHENCLSLAWRQHGSHHASGLCRVARHRCEHCDFRSAPSPP